MPYVHIDWVAGQSPEKRDDVAKRVSTAVSEVTGLGLGDIWVVFKEIDAERNRQHRRGYVVPAGLGETRAFASTGTEPLELMVIGVARDMDAKLEYMASEDAAIRR